MENLIVIYSIKFILRDCPDRVHSENFLESKIRDIESNGFLSISGIHILVRRVTGPRRLRKVRPTTLIRDKSRGTLTTRDKGVSENPPRKGP